MYWLRAASKVSPRPVLKWQKAIPILETIARVQDLQLTVHGEAHRAHEGHYQGS